MKPDIKICGLKTGDALDAAIMGGASHVGFIFFEKSPRYVTADEAARLRSAARGKAKAVAVTVDADDTTLDAIVKTMAPDMLQLHGRETPQRVGDLKARHGLPIIKAFAIREQGDLDRIAAYRGIADRFLFDARAPAGAELPGGNGIAFDWSLLAGFDPDVDFMLSGGLNAGNVARALTEVRPRGIDISSGVESAPGVKDPARIKAFFDAANAALATSEA